MDNAQIDEFLRKYMTSCFIYPIYEAEQIFGDLWGEHKDESVELTPAEQEMEEKFMLWRQKVMDYGNYRIRAAKNEVRKLKAREERNGQG